MGIEGGFGILSPVASPHTLYVLVPIHNIVVYHSSTSTIINFIHTRWVYNIQRKLGHHARAIGHDNLDELKPPHFAWISRNRHENVIPIHVIPTYAYELSYSIIKFVLLIIITTDKYGHLYNVVSELPFPPSPPDITISTDTVSTRYTQVPRNTATMYLQQCTL